MTSPNSPESQQNFGGTEDVTARLQASANLIESVETALFSLDRQWKFTYINAEGENLVGSNREQLLGKSLWECFPPLIGSPIGNAYRQAMDTGQSIKIEDFYQPRQHWYEIHITPTKEGLAVYFRDITVRKKFEDQLRESEERFRILEEASFEGILVHDKGQILDANQTLVNMFGYTLPELVATPFLQLVAPQSRALVEKRMTEGYIGYYEAVGLRKDGTTFPFETQGRFIHYQGKQVRIKAIRDVTERFQFAARLKESEERYKILSEASYEGLCIFSDGVIIDANQRLAVMLGYTLEEFIGMPVARLIAPQSSQTIQDRIATNITNAVENIGLRKDGTFIPLEARGMMIEYRGRPARALAVRDLTEIKQAEEKLQKTQAQLQQAQRMESIGRLAGGIAHDFNNLLTAIIGYSQLAALTLTPGDPIEGDLEEILNASERAANLTRQLLAFSRQQILQPKIINLNDRVKDMTKLLLRLIGEDIELVSLMEPELGLTLIDTSQFEQVIMNLAVNSRDAMPNGGKLTIETANVELDAEFQSQLGREVKTGQYVMLAVSDNGIGMDEVTRAMVFEPFYTTKDLGKGTGLGLSTVYGIVSQSEGYIFVYSEPSIGTTFKIYLPRYSSELDGKRILPLADAGLNGNLNKMQGTEMILVVEDDEAVRNLIIRSLQAYGYHLLEAPNGEEALALLELHKDQIQLILTDIIMPRLGGRELAEQAEQKGIKIKILCMSGYTDRAVNHHNILSHCKNFLQKPFTPQNLVSKVRETLNEN